MIVFLVLATFFNLPLWLGVTCHEGSTLLVVLNGLRVLYRFLLYASSQARASRTRRSGARRGLLSADKSQARVGAQDAVSNPTPGDPLSGLAVTWGNRIFLRNLMWLSLLRRRCRIDCDWHTVC